MKFLKLAALLMFICVAATAQKVNKFIKEKDVTRVIKTLSSDEMKGRPSRKFAQIQKSVEFIESEFKEIGLEPLSGLTGFRQELKGESALDMISTVDVKVTLDGKTIEPANTVLISDKLDLSIDNGLSIKAIEYNPAEAANQRYVTSQMRSMMRDTSSTLVLVAMEYQQQFREFKKAMSRRAVSGRKNSKVFVLGAGPATSYSIQAKQKVEPNPMMNVVGMLKGTTKPDEYVVFSGHYDHLGILTPVEGDSIANGADDDASGTTAVIALARYFKKMKKNARTLIFVAFTAEEVGGSGSQYFSKQLPADKIVAMFNIEMIGKPSKWGKGAAFITGFERSDFGKILQKNAGSFKFEPDPYPTQNLFYRSDNATLARLGVPAHTISTDQIDIDKFYHTVNDEFETLDMDNLTSTIRAIALASRSIVASEDTPTRVDKSAVR
jgi:hypothetical protein